MKITTELKLLFRPPTEVDYNIALLSIIIESHVTRPYWHWMASLMFYFSFSILHSPLGYTDFQIFIYWTRNCSRPVYLIWMTTLQFLGPFLLMIGSLLTRYSIYYVCWMVSIALIALGLIHVFATGWRLIIRFRVACCSSAICGCLIRLMHFPTIPFCSSCFPKLHVSV